MSIPVLQRASSSSPAAHSTPATPSEFTPSISERTRPGRETPTSSFSMNVNGNGNGHMLELGGGGEGSAPRREPPSINMDANRNGTGIPSVSGNRDNMIESIPDPTKKRKKKGWKGWALVIEDEQGNIIEVNDGPKQDGPLPPRRPKPITTNSHSHSRSHSNSNSNGNARSSALLTDGHSGSKHNSAPTRSELSFTIGLLCRAGRAVVGCMCTDMLDRSIAITFGGKRVNSGIHTVRTRDLAGFKEKST